ncbi:hypothetical protein NXZ79_13070 [Lysinibacillus sp. PB211]|nr:MULTISPECIES: hypothetical protein [Lysinibacillus]MCS1396962.1 hypothetical protein [Lysinibacillus sp. PB211]QPA60628.1 hypothetical protein INQ55_09990 [Lysinibacillus sphaericus]
MAAAVLPANVANGAVTWSVNIQLKLLLTQNGILYGFGKWFSLYIPTSLAKYLSKDGIATVSLFAQKIKNAVPALSGIHGLFKLKNKVGSVYKMMNGKIIRPTIDEKRLIKTCSLDLFSYKG